MSQNPDEWRRHQDSHHLRVEVGRRTIYGNFNAFSLTVNVTSKFFDGGEASVRTGQNSSKMYFFNSSEKLRGLTVSSSDTSHSF